jgi:hypothetical protein
MATYIVMKVMQTHARHPTICRVQQWHSPALWRLLYLPGCCSPAHALLKAPMKTHLTARILDLRQTLQSAGDCYKRTSRLHMP